MPASIPSSAVRTMSTGSFITASLACVRMVSVAVGPKITPLTSVP
ncbi:hypothetical protein [Amycolatopsis dongchuanensis]